MSCPTSVSDCLFVLTLAGWDEGVAKVSECSNLQLNWLM